MEPKCGIVALLLALFTNGDFSSGQSFDENYRITWGQDHVFYQGPDVHLSLDQSSGAGFMSKMSYGSGYFDLRIKLPPKDSAGVVTAFYLSSKEDHHDELDFEFLGNKEGKPITLQTNVFAYGEGRREERMLLWFDPTADFHSYKILWNPFHIVFYVDDIPIRVYKNLTSNGVKYPSQPMAVEAGIWNGDAWATDGGQTKTDWAHAPFTAQFQGFGINGCTTNTTTTTTLSIEECRDETKYWWNGEEYRTLSLEQQKMYEDIRSKYVNYDYCKDKSRFPVLPPECPEDNE
ncbi:hypothetical protein V2J09_003240 [Rumex salicifolius]